MKSPSGLLFIRARAGLLSFFAVSLVLPARAAADPIVSASTFVSEPADCGSVCIPAISQGNGGVISSGILSSITSLDQVEFSEARIDLTKGDAGVAVANDRGSSRANASHFDTWFCTDPALCAALATPGSFVPVTINLHVSGNASLTPGFMDLSYTYDTNSLLGSSALGRFDFSFFEDPGRGPDADIEAQATFHDDHTGVIYNPFVDIQSQGPNTGFISFSTNFQVNTFVGGCAVMGCDLSQGIFNDTQSLSAQIDHANDDSAEILNSFNTFSVSFDSNLPFVSADGRTAGSAVAAPEPSTWILTLLAAILLGALQSALHSKSRNWRKK